MQKRYSLGTDHGVTDVEGNPLEAVYRDARDAGKANYKYGFIEFERESGQFVADILVPGLRKSRKVYSLDVAVLYFDKGVPSVLGMRDTKSERALVDTLDKKLAELPAELFQPLAGDALKESALEKVKLQARSASYDVKIQNAVRHGVDREEAIRAAVAEFEDSLRS